MSSARYSRQMQQQPPRQYGNSRHAREVVVRPSLPVVKYELPRPQRAALNEQLGPPGYFPHLEARQPEEDMSLINVINGYRHPTLVADEFVSMVDFMRGRDLNGFEAHVIEKLNDIAYLRVQYESSRPVEIAKIDGTFPKQMVRSEAPEEFIKELADLSVPLHELVQKGIPHGPREDALIRLLVDFRVPMVRATWFAKITFLNSNRSRRPGQGMKEWGTTLCEYLNGQIRQLGRTKNLHMTQEQQRERKKLLFRFQYVTKLIHWSYDEKLIDEYSIFAQLLSEMNELSGAAELTMLIYVLMPFMNDLSNHRTLMEMLIALCLAKNQKAQQRAGETVTAKRELSDAVANVLRFVLVTFPDLLAHAYSKGELDRIIHGSADDAELGEDEEEEDEDMGESSDSDESEESESGEEDEGERGAGYDMRRIGLCYGQPFLLCGDLGQLYLHNEEVIKQRASFMQSLVKFRPDTTACTVVKLLDSYMEHHSMDMLVQELLMPPSSRHRNPSSRSEPTILAAEHVKSMCLWAVTNERAGVQNRAVIVAELTKRYQKHSLSSDLRSSRSGPSPREQLALDLLDFSVNYHTRDSDEISALAVLFGEFIRVGIFMNDSFSRIVVARGLLRKEESKAMMSSLMMQLPIFACDNAHNERKTLLRPWLPSGDATVAEEATELIISSLEAMDSAEAARSIDSAPATLPLAVENVCLCGTTPTSVTVMKRLPRYHQVLVTQSLATWADVQLTQTSLTVWQMLYLAEAFSFADDLRPLLTLVLKALETSPSLNSVCLALASRYLRAFDACGHLLDLVNALGQAEEKLGSSGQRGLAWSLLDVISRMYNTRTRKQANKRSQQGEDFSSSDDPLLCPTIAVNKWGVFIAEKDPHSFALTLKEHCASASQVLGLFRGILARLIECKPTRAQVQLTAELFVALQQQSSCTAPHAALLLQLLKAEFLDKESWGVITSLLHHLTFLFYVQMEHIALKLLLAHLESAAGVGSKVRHTHAASGVQLLEITMELIGGERSAFPAWISEYDEERKALALAELPAHVFVRLLVLLALVEEKTLARGEEVKLTGLTPVVRQLLGSSELRKKAKLVSGDTWSKFLQVVPKRMRRNLFHAAFYGVPESRREKEIPLQLQALKKEGLKGKLCAMLWEAVKRVNVWNGDSSHWSIRLILDDCFEVLSITRPVGKKRPPESSAEADAAALPVQLLAELIIYRACAAHDSISHLSNLVHLQSGDVHQAMLRCIVNILGNEEFRKGALPLRECVWKSLSKTTLSTVGDESLDDHSPSARTRERQANKEIDDKRIGKRREGDDMEIDGEVEEEQEDQEGDEREKGDGCVESFVERSVAECRLHEALLTVATPSLQDTDSDTREKFMLSLLQQFQKALVDLEELERTSGEAAARVLTAVGKEESVSGEELRFGPLQLSLMLPLRFLGCLLTSVVQKSRSGQTSLYDDFAIVLLRLSGTLVVQTTYEGMDLFSYVVSMLDGLLEPLRAVDKPHAKGTAATQALCASIESAMKELRLEGSYRTRVIRALPELKLRAPKPPPWTLLEDVPESTQELEALFGDSYPRGVLTHVPDRCRFPAGVVGT